MSSKANVFDESHPLDTTQSTGSSSLCSRNSGFGARLPLLVISIGRPCSPPQRATCGSRGLSPPVLSQLRHGGSSHEVFTAFREVTGMQIRGLSTQIGSTAVCSLWDGVRTETEAMILLLGSGAALMAGQRKRTRPWSTLTGLAFGRQSQVHQALAKTVAQNWWLRTVHRWMEFLQRASTAGCLCSLLVGSGPPAQRPHIIELTNFSGNLREHEFGYWLHH